MPFHGFEVFLKAFSLRFQDRFLPIWVRKPSFIHTWLSYVQDRGLGATHVPVRQLHCPHPHGPQRLSFECTIRLVGARVDGRLAGCIYGVFEGKK